MSRSRKKPIYKDKDRTKTNWWNKVFRRVNKQRIKSNKEPKLMNELVNKYDVSDWSFNAEGSEFEDKIRRK